MDYTISDFNRDYPDEDACLMEIFRQRYGELTICPHCGKNTKFHKVSGRKCYACQQCGFHLYPLADTIFNKSATPLKLWFLAIFLMSHPGNDISAKEIERQLGVTYKTAWRIAKEVKGIMNQLLIEPNGKPGLNICVGPTNKKH